MSSSIALLGSQRVCLGERGGATLCRELCFLSDIQGFGPTCSPTLTTFGDKGPSLRLRRGEVPSGCSHGLDDKPGRLTVHESMRPFTRSSLRVYFDARGLDAGPEIEFHGASGCEVERRPGAVASTPCAGPWGWYGGGHGLCQERRSVAMHRTSRVTRVYRRVLPCGRRLLTAI